MNKMAAAYNQSSHWRPAPFCEPPSFLLSSAGLKIGLLRCQPRLKIEIR